MKKTLMTFGFVALATTGFGADLGSVTKDGLTVRFAECRKCPHRMRLDADAKGATVNLARLTDDSPSAETLEARKAKMAERAFAILKAAADTRNPSLKRPLMGWSSWNTFGLEIDEAKIASVAEAMSTNGLAAAGYRYVNIDDGFFVTHDAEGRLTFHPERFPRGMKPLVDRIHALGLKAGVYSDAGADTCGSMWGGGDKGGVKDAGRGAGLYGHDAADCKLHFLDTGFDFIKVDYCGASALGLEERARYTEIAKAIRATGRDDVRFNVCRWAFPGIWVRDIAESWRTTVDIRASWPSVRGIIAENLYLGAYPCVGHYNDMDMLEAGQLKGVFKTVFGNEDAGLTEEEEQTHFGMWCMLSSPLLLGCDVRTMPRLSLKLVTNPYLLSLNQNDLAAQPSVAWRHVDNKAYAIVKDAGERDSTSRYLALYNATDAEYVFKVPFKDLCLGGKVAAVDLVEAADIGEGEGVFEMTVPAHGARFYRLDAEQRLEQVRYEAEDAFLSAYHELGDPIEEGFAYPDAIPWASGWTAVRGVGNIETNDLVWKRVHIVNAGRRRLEFSYRTRASRHFFVQVDGGEPVRLEAKGPTGGGFKQVSLEVDLTTGDHTVRIFNPDSRAPVFDCMNVCPTLNRDARWDDAVLRATTDHADALYKCGEKMVFTLNAEGVKGPAEGPYYLDWKQQRDDGTERSGVEPFDPSVPKVFETSIDRPGFVRYCFTLLGADRRPIYKSKDGEWGPISFTCECGAGAEPEKLDFPPEPKDFDAFWRKQLAELRKVPRNAKVEKIEIENESVDCYRLSIPCAGGRPTTGYMTVPKGPKDAKWPLNISFHGYGTFTQTAPKSGPKDKIDISINAHGYDLDRESEYYKEFWKSVKLNERGQYGMDPADNARSETSYFRGMVLRAVRAIEWAKTLPSWDGKNLRVWGASQGGLQCFWAAAFVDGITELEPIVPWGADIIGKTKGRYSFSGLRLEYAPGLDYYEAVNFAKRIPATCRVNISRAGLGDIHCPPSGQWLLYRAIKAPKSITFLQNSNHGGAPGGEEKNQHTTYSEGVAKDAPKGAESSATSLLGDAWNK